MSIYSEQMSAFEEAEALMGQEIKYQGTKYLAIKDRRRTRVPMEDAGYVEDFDMTFVSTKRQWKEIPGVHEEVNCDEFLYRIDAIEEDEVHYVLFCSDIR
jgi:hypothetical protein